VVTSNRVATTTWGVATTAHRLTLQPVDWG
jgi:hypothetical protein